MTSTENYFEDLINGGAYPSKEIIKYFSKRTESLFDAVYEVERRDKRRDLEFISGAFFKCFEKTEMYKFLHEKIVYFLDSFDLSRYTVFVYKKSSIFQDLMDKHIQESWTESDFNFYKKANKKSKKEIIFQEFFHLMRSNFPLLDTTFPSDVSGKISDLTFINHLIVITLISGVMASSWKPNLID